ncbi:hypothetical protein FIU83_14115 [Halomonas sp. THAF5a]|uniref:hypothetical protein n=1 Tax=Halomonas sp. THAF5a TaxID=2587844 RepID=UPI0012697B35|nr:hypothetical protein [Halomonas sp. THAF5a]QFU02776.1 hypothetical protein FIU83_14115 [Halomonas sp. THAF5a]
MPACPPETHAHPSPVDQPLSITYDHEAREMERYRGLALSFLPSHPHVSRLMAALGIECEQRLAALETLAERLERRSCLPAPLARRRDHATQYRQHLFIRDDATAAQTLSYALAFAQHSLQFSELMARHCQLAGLDTLLTRFADGKRRECRLLEELRDQSPVTARATGSFG